MTTEKSDDADGGEGLPRDGAPGTGAGAAPGTGAGAAPGTGAAPESEDEASRGPAVRRVDLPDEDVVVVRAGPGGAEPYDDDHAEEERGWSFAAKALTFLLLLLAGAALGLWAAPRLAPMLPSGLAPAAAWLTPGRGEAEAEAEARLAAVGARVEEAEVRLGREIADLRTRVATAPDPAAFESQTQELVNAAVSAEAGALRDELGARIDELSAAVGGLDMSATSERVGRLETGLEGVTAELDSLKRQLETVEAAPNEEVVAQIDTNRAELDGLRAEVNDLSGLVSGLQQQLEEAQAAAEARVAEAEQAAQAAEEQARAAEAQAQAEVQAAEQAAAAQRASASAQAEVATIRAALVSGEPYEDALIRLEETVEASIPDGLRETAFLGAPTLGELRAGFSDAAHQAIRAGVVAEAEGGLLARSRAFLEAQVASRSLTPQPGDTTDAILSRMEAALGRDDLQEALREAAALPEASAAAMGEWLEAARRRADAETGLAQVSAALSATN